MYTDSKLRIHQIFSVRLEVATNYFVGKECTNLHVEEVHFDSDPLRNVLVNMYAKQHHKPLEI